ncbi:hypothetical protein E2C01_095719 [Portunus trituberculatus]|uniref:Uncharacterized protein n=1 Tax=Portunus trituberculatus TaxID=210409 RepID=A0A5B7K4Y7_PORTR|nr:hypothetical protein [Portunus trituberculatus]
MYSLFNTISFSCFYFNFSCSVISSLRKNILKNTNQLFFKVTSCAPFPSHRHETSRTVHTQPTRTNTRTSAGVLGQWSLVRMVAFLASPNPAASPFYGHTAGYIRDTPRHRVPTLARTLIRTTHARQPARPSPRR